MYVLIPAAGNGSRFFEAGYEEPKPMIDVLGRPMIHHVIDNVTPQYSQPIVICRVEHNLTLPTGCIKVELDHQTAGAVDTLLEAEELFTADMPFVLANSDQLVDFDVNNFVNTTLDGRIVTFKSNKDHHSYVKTTDGIITDIKEKVVISNQAVTGVYYFASSTDFFAAAHKIVDSDIRTNNEHYVSSVISQLISDGKQIGTYDADSAMLGTPSELQHFLVGVKIGMKL